MTESVLKVENLTTHLHMLNGVYPVVEGLTFDLYKGKTLALVGESGCGKTMAAMSVMRILPEPLCPPPKGKIIYQGENLLSISEASMRKIRGAKIAMIFQDPTSALNPVYTVGDQLVEVAQLHLNLYGKEAIALAMKVLSDVGIGCPQKCLDDYPHQLSGGMRQRVMIAMALMCEPDILIADEPTTALDVTIQAQVLELMKELQKKNGMAILLITHDMGVVAEMADDVIVMYAGQGVEKGSVQQIFDSMSHPYTMGLFASRPSIDAPRGSRLVAIKGSVPPLTRFPKGCRFHPRCSFCMDKCCNGTVPEFPGRDDHGHVSKCWLWDDSEESAKQLNTIARSG